MKAAVFPLLMLTSTLLTGCAVSYPIYVKNPQNDETFIGQATSRLTGDSDFQVANADGVICTGKYKAPVVATTQDAAAISGTLVCSDGRKGTWVVAGSEASGGQGVGKLDGQKVIIMYGSMVRVSNF